MRDIAADDAEAHRGPDQGGPAKSEPVDETVAAARPVATTKPPATRRARWANLIAVLAVGIAVLVLSIILGRAYTPLTQFDEGVHFDYIVKILDERGLPTVADTLSPDTVKEYVCRGAETTCSTPITLDQIPVAGVNYVLMYAPVYYLLDAAVAVPLRAVTGMTLFEAARIASSVLYALGSALFLAVAIRLGAHRGAAIGIVLAISVAPLALLQGSTVTPDGLAPLFAAGLVWAATLRGSWRRRIIVTVAIAVLAALNKSNFIPLATAGIWFATFLPVGAQTLSTFRSDFRANAKRYVIGVALSLLPLLAQSAWNTWRIAGRIPGREPDGGLNTIMYTDGSILDAIFSGVRALLQPIHDSGFPPSPELWSIGYLLQALVFGGVFLFALRPLAAADDTTRVGGMSATAGILLSFVFLPVTFYVLYHSIGTQSRYGLPLMIFAAIIVVATIRGRVAGWVLAVSGLLVYVHTIGEVLTTPTS
jgi:hypothetical protein